MRKIYFSIIAALVATTASAQSLMQNLNNQRSLRPTQAKEIPAFAKGKKIGKLATAEMRAATSRKAPRKVADDTTQIVKEQPEGTLLKNWYASTLGYGSFWGYLYNSSSDGDTKDIVVADNGDVWIKDPVTAFPTDSWVKGTKTVGDTIEVKLPQRIYSEGGESGDEDDIVFNYSAWALKYTEVEEEGEYYVDFVPTEDGIVKYVLRNDSLIKLDNDIIVGIGTSEAIPEYDYPAASWAGYAEYAMEAVKFDVPTSAPSASAKVEDYLMTFALTDSTTDARPVKVAIDGTDIYLGSLSDNQPDNWAKGKLEGGKATFEPCYLGVDTVTYAHTFFYPVASESVWDDIYEEYYDSVYTLEEIVFDYDADAKTLKTEGDFIINKGQNYVNAQAEYDKASLAYFKETPGKPQAPIILDFFDYDEDYGYGGIQFDLPKYSVDGNYLFPSKLVYNLYFDNEKYTFYPDEYPYDVTEEAQDVPYLYGGYDISYSSGDTHTVYFYTQGASYVGVQQSYIDGDTRYDSDITTIDVQAAGIRAAITDAATKSVTYTDLAGRRVSKPAHGLFVKTVVKADGKVQTSKVILK